MTFKAYHFHIYFNQKQKESAAKLVEKLSRQDNIAIGQIIENPIGPHPVGSCQITVPASKFHSMSEWFMQNRMGLSIFVHALSGNDLIDHTDYVMWIGQSYDLNLDFFKTK